jgi:hypothetical protein
VELHNANAVRYTCDHFDNFTTAMNFDQLIKHFGTQSKAADALGCSQPTLSNWKTRGRIPGIQQLRIEHLTKGRLKAEKSILKVSRA